jgi:hypothetical protein
VVPDKDWLDKLLELDVEKIEAYIRLADKFLELFKSIFDTLGVDGLKDLIEALAGKDEE